MTDEAMVDVPQEDDGDWELDEYEELESMDVDELLAFAAETFNAHLNRHKSKEALVDDIMDLYVQAERIHEINEANLEKTEAFHLAQNSGLTNVEKSHKI